MSKKEYALKDTIGVEVLVSGDWFVLCPERIEKYLDEIEKWEIRLAECTHTEFWSVETYFIHCKRDNPTEDDDIRDDLKNDGFVNLADKYGIAYVEHVYLKRLKASCSCRR